MSNTGTFKALGELPDDVIENFTKGEYDICKVKCNSILVSNPNNGIAFIYLGKIAESENDLETAITHYKKVTVIEPRFPYIWSFIGENYMKLEKYKEAYDAYLEEVSLIYSEAAPWCMLSICAQKMNDRELALGILRLAHGKVDKEGTSMIAFAIGALEEIVGNNDEALVNYIQGQMSALDEENKNISAERIYKMLKRK